MTIDTAVAHAIKYGRQIILVALLVLLAAVILQRFGVRLPISTPGHIELAYLAGVYWLTK